MILKFLIYLLGLFLLGGIVHELFHYWDCGGKFISGFYWDGNLTIEATWCARESKHGELFPTVLEILIWILGIALYRYQGRGVKK